MDMLLNWFQSFSNREIAFAIVTLLTLSAFLIPMYIVNCTGRNLMNQDCGRVAYREWLIWGMLFYYERYPASCKKRWGHESRFGKKSVLCLGHVHISWSKIPYHQRTYYRRVYKATK